MPGEDVRARARRRLPQTTCRSFTPGSKCLSTPVFWLLYIMFVMVISIRPHGDRRRSAPIAKDFGITDTIVLLFGATTLSARIDHRQHLRNGGARPLFRLDLRQYRPREHHLVLAFGLGGIAYCCSSGSSLSYAPLGFVIFAAMIFLTWGEIFSLFPSTCTDTFGSKFATVNLSLLYTAKGTSAFLVPLANVIKDASGSWHMVFVVTAIMNFVVVGLALFVLKPLRARLMAQSS